MNAISAAIPTSPLVDAAGNIRPEWRAFFSTLWLRTGGAIGQSTDTEHLQQQIDNEAATRSAADTALTTNLDAETAARKAGDQANQQALDTAINQEIYLRQQGDAQTVALLSGYVPTTQLCTMWAACDLSFLPTGDPGHGQPWLNGGVVTVGTPPAAMVGIGLEDATGDWLLQDGTGHWLYG